MLTPKQERNGVGPDPAPGHSTAVPGPDTTSIISPAKGQSESAALGRAAETIAEFQTPAGSGRGGHTVGAGGSMFEWDAGLPIDEGTGEA
jgi:hypothetical protein